MKELFEDDYEDFELLDNLVTCLGIIIIIIVSCGRVSFDALLSLVKEYYCI